MLSSSFCIRNPVFYKPSTFCISSPFNPNFPRKLEISDQHIRFSYFVFFIMRTAVTSMLAVAAAMVPTALAQVSGSPFGFAKDATGGGDVTPAVPADIDE